MSFIREEDSPAFVAGMILLLATLTLCWILGI